MNGDELFRLALARLVLSWAHSHSMFTYTPFMLSLQALENPLQAGMIRR